jgi:RNA polymerase sigma-70 factor (ECF subfamily)
MELLGSTCRPMRTREDIDLVRAYRKEGNAPALGELYRRYAHLVVGLCLNYLKDRTAAQDATMEIFEKVTLKIRNQPLESFRAWLFYISRNHCIDLLRKQRREREQKVAYKRQFAGSVYADALPLRNDRLEKLSIALAKLPEKQAICVKLFYLHGKSYKEVGDITGFNPKQVKSYLQNGRRNLKNTLLSFRASFESPKENLWGY